MLAVVTFICSCVDFVHVLKVTHAGHTRRGTNKKHSPLIVPRSSALSPRFEYASSLPKRFPVEPPPDTHRTLRTQDTHRTLRTQDALLRDPFT